MKKMKYIVAASIAALSVASAVSSCDLETSSAGDFDGMWHLTSVDTIATGGRCDLSREKIYWSFQYKLMEADDKNGNHRSILMRYNENGKKLVLNSPYAYNRTEGDEPLTEPTLLKPFGINKVEEEFQVNKVSGSRMQLQSDMLILNFKKF